MADPSLILILQCAEQNATRLDALYDEVRVQGAILQRVDNTLSGLVAEIRATHAQMSRMQDRLRKVEETR